MGQKVLIADDDLDARLLWSEVSREEALEVVEAEDGRQAIDILKSEIDFSLIILDIMMPYAGGYDVLKVIRDDERLKNLPVIISTADRTTRSLSSDHLDQKTSFINKAAGLDNMRRGILNALGKV
jgi:CheY-like chemotaxis protein